MAWIESHTVLIRHRKIIELAKDLRLKPVYVIGHLHALWYATLEQQEDGDLSSWTDEFIAESCCYQGDAPQFVSLLQKHKWLDGKVVHDWWEYAGRYLESKYKTSNPKKLHKIMERLSVVGLKVALRKPKVSPPNQPDLTNQTLPNQPNLLKAKEPPSPSPQQIFVSAFSKVYTEITGQPFKQDKRHFVIAANLIKTHGLDAVNNKSSLLCRMCSTGETWFVKGGMADFTIENLSRHWNSIIPQEKMSDAEIKDLKFKTALKEQKENDEQYKTNLIGSPGQ